MRLVRRHLTRGVAVWLMCHALAFTALVPRDCCAAHRHGEAPEPSVAADAAPCHDEAPAPSPGEHCPMPSAEGAACPMHRTPAQAPAGDCAMRGACQAPASALAAMLLQSAVLAPPLHVVPLVAPQVAVRPPDVAPRSLATPPDAPPPRA